MRVLAAVAAALVESVVKLPVNLQLVAAEVVVAGIAKCQLVY